MPTNAGAPYYLPPGAPVYYVYPVPLTMSPSASSSTSSSSSYSPFLSRSWSGYPDEVPIPQSPRPRIIPLPDIDNFPRASRVSDHRKDSAATPLTRESPRARDRPVIDPLIALSPHPNARPRFQWDLMYDPPSALLENTSLSQGELRRPAVRSSAGDAGQSLVLMFPLLPMQIEIAPSRASRSAEVTIWDVFEGLYRGLRAPIEPSEFKRLDASGQATLLRAAEMRSRCLPTDAYSRDALRRIDYLARRRIFLGLRPALPHELPRGRRLGEVFFVEVGTGDRS